MLLPPPDALVVLPPLPLMLPSTNGAMPLTHDASPSRLDVVSSMGLGNIVEFKLFLGHSKLLSIPSTCPLLLHSSSSRFPWASPASSAWEHLALLASERPSTWSSDSCSYSQDIASRSTSPWKYSDRSPSSACSPLSYSSSNSNPPAASSSPRTQSPALQASERPTKLGSASVDARTVRSGDGWWWQLGNNITIPEHPMFLSIPTYAPFIATPFWANLPSKVLSSSCTAQAVDTSSYECRPTHRTLGHSWEHRAAQLSDSRLFENTPTQNYGRDLTGGDPTGHSLIHPPKHSIPLLSILIGTLLGHL
ncbi:uncharacterized protein LACBIDRAFT_333828 [Laccaria bicolor S238N-H82]|uniref:Predicted protein n=1 Tax=Laccaria bicolor (strain S238N-H82 / ATCC MYA-4686) TaxID=486041 RepID=B0DX75_LACBS|nr:uncharacterized protein LACBIDRAFT_333828 [Laccaria bicolor S238N-H82]EDR00785.1 predicted protein [Laccaria bicolor S238N-H82]|eukprot:XP_001888577.1 predicted protein [Laccaria bicolor S238N-H82]